MLRLGFVDHHLNNFHANKFLALLHGPLAREGARVVAAWESHPGPEDWCAANGVARASSAAEVAEEVDGVLVLAPDNIDAHLELCRSVLPAGKPVYIDKFLAPDVETARQILGLARDCRTPVFSASALRFAVELEAALGGAEAPPEEAFARGMGEWDLYGVHTVSLLLGMLGPKASRVIDTGTDSSAAVTLQYRDGRRGWIDVREAENQWEVLPWTFGFRVGERYVTGTVADFDGFYSNLMRRALEFFNTRVSPVSVGEMLKVVAVLEGAARSRELGGAWLPV